MSIPSQNFGRLLSALASDDRPGHSFAQENRLAAIMRDVLANALPPRITMRPLCRCRKHRRSLDSCRASNQGARAVAHAPVPIASSAGASISRGCEMTAVSIHAKPADDSAAGLAARRAIRRGDHLGPTSGLAPGFAQANLAILPRSLAADFARFCALNPKPCPLIGVAALGDWRIPALG